MVIQCFWRSAELNDDCNSSSSSSVRYEILYRSFQFEVHRKDLCAGRGKGERGVADNEVVRWGYFRLRHTKINQIAIDTYPIYV